MCTYSFQHRSAAPMEIGWLVTRAAKSCSTFLPTPQSPHQAGIRVLLQWEVSQISMRKTPIDVCTRQFHICRLAQLLRPSDTSVPVFPSFKVSEQVQRIFEADLLAMSAS